MSGGEQFNSGPQKELEEVFSLAYPGLKHRACFEETSGRLRQRADRETASGAQAFTRGRGAVLWGPQDKAGLVTSSRKDGLW